MGDEVLGHIAAGVVTLVVGYVLFQVQQGSRRRRKRREIREELELVGLLGVEHAEVADRLRQRIDGLLQGYEPPPRARKGVPIAVVWLIAAGALTVLVSPLVLLIDSRNVIIGLGFAVGLGASMIADRETQRRERALAEEYLPEE